MAKPTIVTRAGKGSALTWTEGDSNLTNLRDATITVTDGTNSKAIDLNGTITFTGGTNVTTSVNTSTGAVTINSSGGSASVSTLTDATITSAAGGDVLRYNAGISKWVNGVAVLSVTGTSGRISVDSSAPKAPVVDLSTSGVTAGSYTAANITVDAYGRITTASNGSSGGGLTITDDTTTDAAHYLTFTSSSSGSITGEKVSVGKLQWNPGLYVLSIAGGISAGSIGGTTISGTTITASIGLDGIIGATTARAGSFDTLSANGTVSGTGFTNRFASPGPIGSTTASTGAFTTLSSTTTATTGAVNITYNPSSTSGAAIQAAGKDSQGGTGYFDFLKATNNTAGVSNGSKTIRLNSTGVMEVINDAYTATILSLTDAGILTTQTLSLAKDVRETVYTGGSTTGTITPNCANGTVQKITLSGNITFNAFASPIAGQSMTMILTQDGTGSRTLTSTMKFAGGSKTLSTAAGSIDILSVFYDGSVYYASLNKGFA